MKGKFGSLKNITLLYSEMSTNMKKSKNINACNFETPSWSRLLILRAFVIL